jgi:hypothetical protein
MATAYDAILKPLYPGDTIEDLSSPARKFWSMVKKTPDFYGLGTLAVPMQTDNIGGSSLSAGNVFRAASAQNTANVYRTFQLVRKHGFAAAVIPNEIAAASENTDGAFVEVVKQEMDGAFDQAQNQLSVLCYGDGGSSIGIRSGAMSGETATLSVTADSGKFRPGMTLVVGPNADGTSLRTITGGSGSADGGVTSGNAVTVAGVGDGTITLTTGDTAAIGSFTAGDYFFEAGSAAAGFFGMDAWIPLTAPGSTTFLGVDRTANLNKLSGIRQASAASLEVGIKKVGAKIFNLAQGGPDAAFAAPEDFDNLTTSLAGKGIYTSQGGEADFGFENVRVWTAGGAVKVYPDAHATAGRCHVNTMASWEFHHLKAVPHIAVKNGSRFIDIDGLDSAYSRIAWYGALACKAPGKNGICSFT